MDPLARYRNDIQQRQFTEDEDQLVLLQSCQQLFEQLQSRPWQRPTLMRKQVSPLKGLYFWGGVGRGKTYILDLLYESLPFSQKKRVHFGEFMRDLHDQMQILGKTTNPLSQIAKKLADRYRIIFIDEFHVDDIADAMILAEFLQALFAEGTTIVTSSNTAPQELYKNGLQRSRFLPAIELLQQYTEVLELLSQTDYRQRFLQAQGSYHIVASEADTLLMAKEFQQMTGVEPKPSTITLNHKPLQILGESIDTAWVDFKNLCASARSSSDFIELGCRYPTLFLNHVPRLHEGQNDQAQRFIQLVDALYDHSVKLILSAEVQPPELYKGQALAGVFQRTASRLLEMRSADYLTRPHKPCAVRYAA
ncbi:MAG: cell division protein ZapE [Gammaproteobacteria bacterium]|nr:cell division protein ZapE [Gammaproteobacteria bacterium]MDH5727901.1 cell division protein ZapE [Gammaproteobacteria bacterium]